MKHAIGIDIGGSKINLALVDEVGCPKALETIPTLVKEGFEAGINRMKQSICGLLSQSGLSVDDLEGIGIGCAGPVDPGSGIIHNKYTLPGWENHDLITPFQEHFHLPVLLDNDAAVALLGEYHFGAGRGMDPVVMLTFGTGVGGATLRGGKLWRGQDGQHPEIGHLYVSASGPACYCGISGCLESVASGTAIERAGQEQGFESARDVFSAMKHGNTDATAIVDEAVKGVALAAWTLAHSLYPAGIILGGGVMEEHFALFAGSIQARLEPGTMIDGSKLDIVSAVLGNRAGVLGAAALLLKSSSRTTDGEGANLGGIHTYE
jgi:glucokinase